MHLFKPINDAHHLHQRGSPSHRKCIPSRPTQNAAAVQANAAAFSRDNKYLAIGYSNGEIKLHDMDDGNTIITMQFDRIVSTTTAFCANIKSDRKSLSPFMHSLMRETFPPTCSPGYYHNRVQFCPLVLQAINTIVFSPDGSTLASGRQHTHIVLWSIPSGKRQKTLKVSGIRDMLGVLSGWRLHDVVSRYEEFL